MACLKHRSLQFRGYLVVWEFFTCFEYATVWTTDTRGDQLNYFKLGVISHASVKANFIINDKKMYPLPCEMIFNFHLKISTWSKLSGLSKK